MIDFECFSWRSITELIRHITFVFVIAFVVAVFGKHYGISELIQRAIMPNNLSNAFCSILVFSVPIYFICVIVDTVDDVRIGGQSDMKVFGFIRSFLSRVFYDITYIVFYFRKILYSFFRFGWIIRLRFGIVVVG